MAARWFRFDCSRFSETKNTIMSDIRGVMVRASSSWLYNTAIFQPCLLEIWNGNLTANLFLILFVRFLCASILWTNNIAYTASSIISIPYCTDIKVIVFKSYLKCNNLIVHAGKPLSNLSLCRLVPWILQNSQLSCLLMKYWEKL